MESGKQKEDCQDGEKKNQLHYQDLNERETKECHEEKGQNFERLKAKHQKHPHEQGEIEKDKRSEEPEETGYKRQLGEIHYEDWDNNIVT